MSNLSLVVLVPRLDGSGPVRGAVALANALSEYFVVHLVNLKKSGCDYIKVDERVKIKELGVQEDNIFKLSAIFRNYIKCEFQRSKRPICISYCLIADLVCLMNRDILRGIGNIRGNLMKNYSFTYGRVMGCMLALLHYVVLVGMEKVVVMNESMFTRLRRLYIKRIKLIGNFVDEKSLEAYRAMRNGEEIRIVFVGGLTERKAPDLLIKAFSELETRKQIRLSIIGEGELEVGLKKLIKERGLQNCIDMHGYQREPAKLVGQADLFVLPSRSEGVSRAAMEALYLGVPCVLRDVDSNVELLEERGSGYLFKKDDELVVCLKRWLEDSIPEKVKYRVSLLPRRFRQEVCARKMIELIYSLERGND